MRFTKTLSTLTHTGFWLVTTALLTALATPALAQSPAIQSGDTIAFMGDSITEGGWGSPVGYVRLVMSALESNGIKAKPILAGISGHKSNDMLKRLRRDVLDKKPTWMTLSCGVNDVWHGANGVPLPQYETNITAIIDQTQAAGIKVLMLTATVIGEDVANDNNQKLTPYNEFLRALAKEKSCLLADANADMQTALAAVDPAVRVPEIRGDARQEIRMHWGKSDAVSASSGTDFNSGRPPSSRSSHSHCQPDRIGIYLAARSWPLAPS